MRILFALAALVGTTSGLLITPARPVHAGAVAVQPSAAPRFCVVMKKKTPDPDDEPGVPAPAAEEAPAQEAPAPAPEPSAAPPDGFEWGGTY